MYFYDALKFIMTTYGGAKIARKTWSDPTFPDIKKFVCKGYDSGNYFIQFRYIAPHEEKHLLYTPSQEDMLATDWYIVES